MIWMEILMIVNYVVMMMKKIIVKLNLINKIIIIIKVNNVRIKIKNNLIH